MPLPPTAPLSRLDRLTVPGAETLYMIGGIWGLLLAPQRPKPVFLKAELAGVTLPLYFGFSGADAVNLARLLLRVVEALEGSERIADVPAHWLEGFRIRAGRRTPSLIDDVLDRFFSSPAGEQRRYDLGKGYRLIALPDLAGQQLALVAPSAEGSVELPMGLDDGERIGRTILQVLGDRPEYALGKWAARWSRDPLALATRPQAVRSRGSGGHA
jgi:hypothetical protein